MAGYRNNSQKLVAFLYTTNKHTEKKIIDTFDKSIIITSKNKVTKNKPNQRGEESPV